MYKDQYHAHQIVVNTPAAPARPRTSGCPCRTLGCMWMGGIVQHRRPGYSSGCSLVLPLCWCIQWDEQVQLKRGEGLMENGAAMFEGQIDDPPVLTLPCDTEEEWAAVLAALHDSPVETPAQVDALLTSFARADPDREQHHSRPCRFFQELSDSASLRSGFDFASFMLHGLPFMLEVALAMPQLFPREERHVLKINMVRSSWPENGGTLGRTMTELSRRQCACLLAHSVLGSLRRPAHVKLNDYRFIAVQLFMGSAVSHDSAFAVLSYFTILGRDGVPSGRVIFERLGYRKGTPPWSWAENSTPLCRVEQVDGAIDECTAADLHVEFSNAFVGGGVMTGDTAMEEILFLTKPELMVSMALQHRMVDEEVVRITGALKYTQTKGFGSSFEYVGEASVPLNPSPSDAPTVAAIDAVRGGGPAMSNAALLRDLNKARIAFEGSHQVATGHWGCGAFGNNHDLMFLKQWLAASEAGAARIYYHDYSRKQSHSIFALFRKLKHLTVGQLWEFLSNELTGGLEPYNTAAFSKRVRDVAVGRLAPPNAS